MGAFPFCAAHPELHYLDAGATSQYPQSVVTAMTTYMEQENAPLHRGLYRTAYAATTRFEDVRAQVARWLHAARPDEVVFTSGATAGLNLVAQSWGAHAVHAGDNIIVSALEHHSNVLPWRALAQRTGATVQVAPLTAAGAINQAWVLAHIDARTRVVALSQMSNVTGAALTDTAELAAAIHAVGGVLVLDGAQGAAHLDVDVQALGCDFYACSGHKVYGPSGIGILYGRADYLVQMAPVNLGGGMIDTVTPTTATWADPPTRFEAGSQNAVGVIGLGAALDFITTDAEAKHDWVDALGDAAWTHLNAIDGVHLYGDRANHGCVSFNLDGVHPHDLATFLDEQDVAVRAGHHCAAPLMATLGITGTARASFGVYNGYGDVAALIAGVQAAKEFFDGTK
ncbi:cysteine desulfurase [Lacticaseibacillus thailandensis DSM 22698 = JCM 13996]|uniref:cysteine desulfurase n=1 Tax=Lacticaseibacillus thailandensis DSM 22698 = JCM 13996 TaxID=1423810 RepID=A0A0R2CH29_9LACO|nr:cysteine desulfurase [Lacticaseibacillus thailandensis DSM 22698 = JCM 13996]